MRTGKTASQPLNISNLGNANEHWPFKERQTLHHLQPLKKKQNCYDKHSSDPPLNTLRETRPANKNIIHLTNLTNNEIVKAMKEWAVSKARWPDDIGFKCIQEAYNLIPEQINSFYWATIRKEFHPFRWREARISNTCNPNKPHYTKPNADWPISLFNCLSKLLEKIIAIRLGYLSEKDHLLQKWPRGSTHRGSAVDTCKLISTTVDNAKNKGQTVSSLCMDVKGAFKYIYLTWLLNELKERDLPPQLSKWVESFLSNSTACLAFDRQINAMSPIRTGIHNHTYPLPTIRSTSIWLTGKKIPWHILDELYRRYWNASNR